MSELEENIGEALAKEALGRISVYDPMAALCDLHNLFVLLTSEEIIFCFFANAGNSAFDLKISVLKIGVLLLLTPPKVFKNLLLQLCWQFSFRPGEAQSYSHFTKWKAGVNSIHMCLLPPPPLSTKLDKGILMMCQTMQD